ncbi:ATP-dependent DNA helicase II 70 kDa subunit (macronuclear) [Tetrahymena thermophila SB210]|uniref:ATP-dependent DNA helicase II 70 kDa subunit n=1 Tax=Tetrahymena thermophila (strain SB210) TaxID=312017 RepID=I7MAM7_TETTS|nr:ATP-dependent DNA helicase II 70 kDa subunit [Tetrahymena thermophila SB210]EAS04900.2 ATP-dependent DNA helicase II 70 kDa subunit [Tetrahymena thermophila SB210]|eukprot:XP_001025145.2 ATP-dependent DNA helicase II 70 kDa subunit [Tetrahymena thermophila SB210]
MEFEDDQSFEKSVELNPLDFQEEEVEQDIITLKDAVLFVVEMSQNLFIPYGDGEKKQIQYQIVMKSLEIFLKTKIICSPTDMIGLLFYNTDQSNIQSFPNQYLLLNLQNPSAQSIQFVKMLQTKEQMNGYQKMKIKNVCLKDLLWNINKQFLNLKNGQYSKRVFLFTSNDEPDKNNIEAQKNAISYAQNLLENDVNIELFPLKKLVPEAEHFNVRKFYSCIINFDLSEINEYSIDETSKIYNLQSRIRAKLFKKRNISRIYWQLGNGVNVGVKVYSLFNKITRPKYKQYTKDDSKPVSKFTRYFCKESGKELRPQEIGKCLHLLNKKGKPKDDYIKVRIDKDELQQIKNLEEVGMKLIGFKDKSFLKVYFNLKPSLFIYPDNSLVKGSSQLFDALIKKMIQKEKVAIVKIINRKGGQLRFGCLLPQLEEYSPVDHVQIPPGFHLITLPYCGEINHLPKFVKPGPTKISQEMILVTKLLMNLLEIQEFDFRNFENPSNSHFYSVLEAIALKEEKPQQIEDLMEVDTERINKFKEVIDLYGDCLDAESTTKDDDYVIKDLSGKRNLDQYLEQYAEEVEEVEEEEYQVQTSSETSKFLKQIFEEEEKLQQKQSLQKQVVKDLKNEIKVQSNNQISYKKEIQPQVIEQKQTHLVSQKQQQSQQLKLIKPSIIEKQISIEEIQKEQKQIVQTKSLTKEQKLFVKTIQKKIIQKEFVSDKEIIQYCQLTNQPL